MKNKYRNIGLGFFVLIGLLPFAAAFIYALLYSFGLIGVLNEGFTLKYWEAVFQSGEFFGSLAYSAAVSAISVLISITLALWLVLKFKQSFEGRRLSFLLYLPLAIPGIVASFFALQLLSKSGFLARISYTLGFITEARQFPDLVNDSYAIGLILTFISLITPFFILLFMNVSKNERIDELSLLAKSLGATNRQIMQRVSVPILLKKTWSLIALYFIFILGAYEVPLILGQESPQMLSVLIIRELKQFDLSKLSEGYVVAVVYTIVVSLATVALFYKRSKTRDAF